MQCGLKRWWYVFLLTAGLLAGLATQATAEIVKSPESVDVGPGFGPRWLGINSLGFAYPAYDVLNTYPYNRLVITKLRWDGTPGDRNEITNIPIGNSKTENSIHFVYDARFRQLGYAISNAADRYGSAHGLQVGVIHLSNNKPRVYLESANYRSDGYNSLAGISMAPDNRGFVTSYKGNLYYMEFGDAGSREKAVVGGSFRDSYIPNFDDSSIKAELLREGHNTRYPIYYSVDNILVYEDGSLSMFDMRTKKVKPVLKAGANVQGVALSENRKTIGVLADNVLALYDIAGNKLQQVVIDVPNARNITLSPDGQYIAFDNLEHVFVKQLVFLEQSFMENQPLTDNELAGKPARPVNDTQTPASDRMAERRAATMPPIDPLDMPAMDTPAMDMPDKMTAPESDSKPAARTTNRLPARPKNKSGTGLASLPEIIKSDPAEKCTSTEKILNLRKRLMGEINALSGSVDPTKLVGLRRIAANLRQMANCQSFVGGEPEN